MNGSPAEGVRPDAPPPGLPSKGHLPRTIALSYLAFGVLWIFFTDRILVWLRFSPERVLQLQTSKGWLFVFGSAALIYALIRRHQRRDEIVFSALLRSQDEVRRVNSDLERRVTERTEQLAAANRELEAFVHAVSHDLRAPLRSMSGFSQVLRDSQLHGLDEKSRHYLERIHEASGRMGLLLEDLLALSRINRSELSPRPTSLTQIAMEAAASVRDHYSTREVTIEIEPNMNVIGDARLLKVALENLIDNAVKYTANVPAARVTVGKSSGQHGPEYFVRDNGAGFDMAYADKLFVPFQRLHPAAEFPGTGIGLVTVQRIIARHGGRIWAVAAPNEGATFYFTLNAT
jgi:light-regulated signal transduction histidine kinase (bacteriophytochrome)